MIVSCTKIYILERGTGSHFPTFKCKAMGGLVTSVKTIISPSYLVADRLSTGGLKGLSQISNKCRFFLFLFIFIYFFFYRNSTTYVRGSYSTPWWYDWGFVAIRDKSIDRFRENKCFFLPVSTVLVKTIWKIFLLLLVLKTEIKIRYIKYTVPLSVNEISSCIVRKC